MEYFGGTPIFLNCVENTIEYSSTYLFADDSKVSRQMSTSTDYKSQQVDVYQYRR